MQQVRREPEGVRLRGVHGQGLGFHGHGSRREFIQRSTNQGQLYVFSFYGLEKNPLE